jgi:hypothetical protein
MLVTRLYCRACDSALEGHFTLGRFYQLTAEQLAFVETFIRCEGKLNRVQQELSISYPTARARLVEVIRALGYEVEEPSARLSADERSAILEQLAQGKITSEEALALIQGE